MKNVFYKIKSKIGKDCITASGGSSDFCETRDISAPKTRDMDYTDANQKTASNAVSGGLKLVQVPRLSTSSSIAVAKTMSNPPVETSGAVEVAGVEPASPWLIILDSNQSTPTA